MSYSRFTYQRFRERALRRRIVALIYVLVMVLYLGWRVTIINADALGLSLIYFTAESLGFLLGLTTIFCSWSYRYREPKPAPRDLTVDVFIPTYKEPVELVRWTVIAANEIAYPHQTFLLDDGNRPEMKVLAQELSVRYLARDRNTNAKAGNLNNALAHSSGEFVTEIHYAYRRCCCLLAARCARTGSGADLSPRYAISSAPRG
jgi:cellulose synthase (UDP-forming)